MDNKKIVTVAVLAVLALAFAGYGYASYTASTYNEGNEVVVNYLTVEPTSWAAIAAASGEDAFEVNTYTDQDKTLYKIAGDDNITKDTKTQYIQIGEDYTLKITDETTEAFDQYTIELSILGEVNNTGGFKLYLKYDDAEDGETYKELASPMTLNVAATADNPTEVVLGLYLGFVYDAEMEFPDVAQGAWVTLLGSDEAPAEDPLLTGPEDADEDHPGATFVFKVTGVINEP